MDRLACLVRVEFLLIALQTVLNAQVAVLTWHNDNARTGQNLQETILTPENVKSTTFGKLFVIAVDGKVDAQPLYVPALTIPGKGVHNVLFVVTEHDSAYAFDADNGTLLWHVSLLGANETSSDDRGCGQVTPEIGITGTPAIDLQSGPHGTIYMVAMSKDGSGKYHQRLHALDLTTGAEEFSGPVAIQATYPGTGAENTFLPQQHKERPGLLILNGLVYTSWGSHCDAGPYTAWVMSYNETTLAQVSVLNLTPNGNDGGIWAAGAGPAVDPAGNIYLLTGNGTFDTTLNSSSFPVNADFGNAFVKMSTTGNQLAVTDYFTMSNTTSESNGDVDLGSGGLILTPPLNDSQGHARSLAVGAGKDGNIYVVDQANMGKFNPGSDGIFQQMSGALPSGAFSTPAWFNGTLYYGGVGDRLKAFTFSGGKFPATPTSQSSNSFGYPGATPSISASGTSNGIVWVAENTSTAVLHAYDASDVSKELYNTNQAPNGRDHFGTGNKYIVPTVVNGKVYVGTTNGVGVFGLLSSSAPTLQISKTHSGNFTQGQMNAVYTVTVSNAIGAAQTSGAVTVTETVPPGLSMVSMLGSGWSCSNNSCSRSDALNGGTSYPAITVKVNVLSNATSPQLNQVSVSGGGSLTANTSDSTVLVPQPPTIVSVTPSSGSGTSQQFTFTWADVNGGIANIQYGSVIMNSTFSLQNACWIVLNVANRTISLANDAGTAFTALSIGSSGTVQNSQCTVNGSGSTLTGSGNNMSLAVNINFNASFTGLKQTYMWVQDKEGVPDSAIWQDMGHWTVSGASNQPPQNVSVNPSSGSGANQQFTFTWSDPNGGIADIQYASVIMNSTFSLQNACWIVLNIANRTISLANDAGTAFTALGIGSSGTVQNSQCTVNGAGSTLTGSGNNMSLVVNMNFHAPFNGLKQTYMWVQDNEGMPDAAIWQDLGTWLVSGGN